MMAMTTINSIKVKANVPLRHCAINFVFMRLCLPAGWPNYSSPATGCQEK
jgi:hypothetical protein